VRIAGEGDAHANAFALVDGEPEAIIRHWLETFATYTVS
jgi:hypothetical protein